MLPVIERKDVGGTYGPPQANDVTGTSYIDNTRETGKDYCYRVYAKTSTGDTDDSNEVCTRNAPFGLTAKAITPTTIELSWTNLFDSTAYVERKTGTGSYETVYQGTAFGSKTITDSISLTANAKYYYRVYKVDGTGKGYSNDVKVFTIPNVTASSHKLNVNSEVSAIQFTVDEPTTVTLKVIPEISGSTGTPIYHASQTYTSAGTYSLNWDGKDITGKILPDDAYLYTLESIQGNSYGYYIPTTLANGTISCSQSGTYDAFQNKSMIINYTPSQAARVNVDIIFPSKYPNVHIPLLSGFPVVAGLNSFSWDGRHSSGEIVTSGGTLECSIASLMRENFIITSGDTPKVSNISVDPSAVNLAYGEFARIKYTLSRDANVTVTLSPNSGGAAIQLSSSPETAGQHEIVWNGLDASDTTGKKFVAVSDGYYTVKIEAVNSSTGSTSIARASLRIGL